MRAVEGSGAGRTTKDDMTVAGFAVWWKDIARTYNLKMCKV